MDMDSSETELTLGDIQEQKPEDLIQMATDIPLIKKKRKNRGKRMNKKVNMKVFRPDGTFYRVKVFKDKGKHKVKDTCTISTETRNSYCNLDSVKELEDLKESIQKELQELDESPDNIVDFIDLTNEINSEKDINEKEKMSEKTINLKSQECIVPKSKSTQIKNRNTETTTGNFQEYDENILPATTSHNNLDRSDIKELIELALPKLRDWVAENIRLNRFPRLSQLHKDIKEVKTLMSWLDSKDDILNNLSAIEKEQKWNEYNKKLLNLQLFENILKTNPKDFDRLVSELTVNKTFTSSESKGIQNEFLHLPVSEMSEKDLFREKFEEDDKNMQMAEFKRFTDKNETQPEVLDRIVCGPSVRKDMIESKCLVVNQAISLKVLNSSQKNINLLNMQNESIDGHHDNLSISGGGPLSAIAKSELSSQGQISEITTRNVRPLEENDASWVKESKVVIEPNSADEKAILLNNAYLDRLVEWVHKRLNINKSTTYEDICREHEKNNFYMSRLDSLKNPRGDQRKKLLKHRRNFTFFCELLTSHLPMFKYVTCKFIENPQLVKSPIAELHKYFTVEDFKKTCGHFDDSSKGKVNSHTVGTEPGTSGSSVRDKNLEGKNIMSMSDQKASTLCNNGDAKNSSPLSSSYSGTQKSGGFEKSNSNKNEICLAKLKDWAAEKIGWNMIPSLSLLNKDLNGVENLLRRLDFDKNDLLYKDLSTFQKIEKRQELRLKLVGLRLSKQILETQPQVLDKLVSEITFINEQQGIPNGSKCRETSAKSEETQDETMGKAVFEVSVESNSLEKKHTHPREEIESSADKTDLLHMPDEFVGCKQGNILSSGNGNSLHQSKSGLNVQIEISESTSSNSNSFEEKKASELSESKDIIDFNNPVTFFDRTTENTDTDDVINFDDLVKWVHKRLNMEKPTTVEAISKEHTKSSFYILKMGGLAVLKKNQKKELIRHRKKISFFSSLLTSHLPMFKFIISKFTDNPVLVTSSVEDIQKYISHEDFEEYCLKNSSNGSNSSNTLPEHVNVEDKSPAPGAPQLVNIKNNTAAHDSSTVITTNISNCSDKDNNLSFVVGEHVTNIQQINSSEISLNSRPPNELLLIFLENWVQQKVMKNIPFTIQRLNHEIKHLSEYGSKIIKRDGLHAKKGVKRSRSLATLLSFAKQLVEDDPSILDPIGAKYEANHELLRFGQRQLDSQSLILFYKWQNTQKQNCNQENIQSKPSETRDVVCFKPRSGHVEQKEVSHHSSAATDSAALNENRSVNVSKNNLKRQNNNLELPLNVEGNTPATYEMSCNSECLPPSKRIKIEDYPVKCAPINEVTDVVPLSPAYAMHPHCINNTNQDNSVIRESVESRLTIHSKPHFAEYGPTLNRENCFPNESTVCKTGSIQTRTQSSSMSLEVAHLSQPLEPNRTPYSSPSFASQLQQMHMFLPTPTVQCCSAEFIQYYPHLNISDVLENIRKRNPGLNCSQWRVHSEWRDELDCFNYSLGVDDESVKFLLSQGNRARVTFKYYALFQKT